MDPNAQSTVSSSSQPSSNSLTLRNAEASAVAGEVPVVTEDCGGVDPGLCLQTLQKMKTL